MAKSRKAAGPARQRSARSVNITQAIRNEETDKSVPSHWRREFLAALAETSNVSRSADAARVSAARAYKVRREDSAFAKQWQEALSEGYDHLELEVLRRLREADFLAADGTKFDFATASRILAAHRETVSRLRAAQTVRSEEDVLASLNAKLDAIKLRDRQIRAKAKADKIAKRKAANAE